MGSPLWAWDGFDVSGMELTGCSRPLRFWHEGSSRVVTTSSLSKESTGFPSRLCFEWWRLGGSPVYQNLDPELWDLAGDAAVLLHAGGEGVLVERVARELAARRLIQPTHTDMLTLHLVGDVMTMK